MLPAATPTKESCFWTDLSLCWKAKLVVMSAEVSVNAYIVGLVAAVYTATAAAGRRTGGSDERRKSENEDGEEAHDAMGEVRLR